MYPINNCPCCNNVKLKKYSALVAPFIAEYLFKSPPVTTNFLLCKECTFLFSQTRYTQDEIQKLYSDYRGSRYFEIRHTYEPWYTERINNTQILDDEKIRIRQLAIETAISPNVQLQGNLSILDYGGDHGQFIPGALFTQKYVYEISGVHAVPGVTLLNSLGQLQPNSIDVVMANHVLEHMSSFEDFFNDIVPLLKKDGGIYLEVPYEPVTLLQWFPHFFHHYYHKFVCSFPLVILQILDMYSLLFRKKMGFVPPLGFLKQHEHINFFTIKSLTYLLEKNGFKLCHSKIVAIPGTGNVIDHYIQCFAKQ